MIFLVERNLVIEPSSKRAVQRFNRNIELLEPLPEKARKILAVLGADGVASEAVKIANCVKSNVCYWKNRFIKAGALRLKQDGIVKYYELTPYGSKLLTGSDGELRLPVVFEDHALKFRGFASGAFLCGLGKIGGASELEKTWSVDWGGSGGVEFGFGAYRGYSSWTG